MPLSLTILVLLTRLGLSIREDDANVAAGCADPEVVAQLRLLQGLYISVNDDVQFAVGIDNVGIAVVLNGILGPSFGFPHYYLPQFRCLQELSLLELGGDLSAWRSSILGLLLANPQLQRLNLSINARTANWYTRETSPANKDVFSSFFAWICREFGDTNTQPLKLRALRLEDSIAIPDETILQRAFDMRVLEEIFVHDERDPWTTPWSILQAPIAPRLQRVYFKGLPDGEFWADFPGAMDGKDDRTLNFSRVGKTVCGAYAAASETPKHVFPRITFGRGRLSSDLEEFHQLRSADEVCSGLPKATHMAVNISIVTEIRESCDYDVSLPWPDLYYTLSFVPTLSSLWIINAADTGGERELPRLSFYEDKDRINIGVDERLAVWLAQGRPSIRYIKVGERAWRFEPVTAGKKWRIWEEVFDENESGESPPKPLNPGPWSFSVGYGRWNM